MPPPWNVPPLNVPTPAPHVKHHHTPTWNVPPLPALCMADGGSEVHMVFVTKSLVWCFRSRNWPAHEYSVLVLDGDHRPTFVSCVPMIVGSVSCVFVGCDHQLRKQTSLAHKFRPLCQSANLFLVKSHNCIFLCVSDCARCNPSMTEHVFEFTEDGVFIGRHIRCVPKPGQAWFWGGGLELAFQVIWIPSKPLF